MRGYGDAADGREESRENLRKKKEGRTLYTISMYVCTGRYRYVHDDDEGLFGLSGRAAVSLHHRRFSHPPWISVPEKDEPE